MRRHNAAFAFAPLALLLAGGCYNPGPKDPLDLMEEESMPDDQEDPTIDPDEPAEPEPEPAEPEPEPQTDPAPATVDLASGVWRLEIDPRPFGEACGASEELDTFVAGEYELVALTPTADGWMATDHQAKTSHCELEDETFYCGLPTQTLVGLMSRDVELELELDQGEPLAKTASGQAHLSVSCLQGDDCLEAAYGLDIRLPCHGPTPVTAHWVEPEEMTQHSCAGLRSLAAVDPAFVVFENTSEEERVVYRIDADESLQEVGRLQPGETSVQASYLSYAYMTTSTDGVCLGQYAVSSQYAVIVVP